jgi:hypothetical protein
VAIRFEILSFDFLVFFSFVENKVNWSHSTINSIRQCKIGSTKILLCWRPVHFADKDFFWGGRNMVFVFSVV